MFNPFLAPTSGVLHSIFRKLHIFRPTKYYLEAHLRYTNHGRQDSTSAFSQLFIKVEALILSNKSVSCI